MPNLTVNYMHIVGTYYPEKQCYTTGTVDNYYSIVWMDNIPISKAELDSKLLEDAKVQKIQELSDACQTAIVSGFLSSALGTPRLYDSQEVDQLNLVGATTATDKGETQAFDSIYYACRDPLTGKKSYELHSNAQLKQILRDGANIKLMFLQQFNTKRQRVYEATTLEQVSSIAW